MSAIKTIQVGDVAPDFKLLASDQKTFVTLGEQKGKKVVLLFFPFAFSGVCTTEFCEIRDNMAYYNDLGATVFGISADFPHALAAFKKEQQLNFELLSDANREAAPAYGAFHEKLGWYKGVAKRAVFVIDAEGVLRYSEVLDNPGNYPNMQALKDALAAL